MHSVDTKSNLGIWYDIIDDFLSKAPPKEAFQRAIENKNPVVRSSFLPLFKLNGSNDKLVSKVSLPWQLQDYIQSMKEVKKEVSPCSSGEDSDENPYDYRRAKPSLSEVVERIYDARAFQTISDEQAHQLITSQQYPVWLMFRNLNEKGILKDNNRHLPIDVLEKKEFNVYSFEFYLSKMIKKKYVLQCDF